MAEEHSDRLVVCEHRGCELEFCLHSVVEHAGRVTCPYCLSDIVFSDGFLLD